MQERHRTRTSSFGVAKREGHDSSAFYERFSPPVLSDDETVNRPPELIDELGSGKLYVGSIHERQNLPESSVALVVTSPPYFVGKDYELAVSGGDAPSQVPATYIEFLDLLRTVFAECVRVLEPGGRIAVNVANLGRKPYRSLSADVSAILQDDLGLLLRGEVIWEKASASSGSCAWGSFAKASNPVLRDMTERVIIASKGRFSRAQNLKARRKANLPWESTITNDEFVETTKDVWRIDAESATRVGHPAPFPVELPLRLIDLYTYKGDIVLDPFAGSGTALVAAARSGRIGVGYDTDPTYVDLSQDRLDAELIRVNKRQTNAQSAEHQLSFTGVVDRSVVPHDLSFGDAPLSGLSLDDKQDRSKVLALAEGKKVSDIVARTLDEAGFAAIDPKAKPMPRVISFDFAVTATGPSSKQWWVEVGGSFTTSHPGLQRSEMVWRLLGKLHVLQASAEEPPDPVLVITPGLPRPASPGDKALRAVGPEVIFDVIELYDPAGIERLSAYATGQAARPLPGFWR